jgi:hypothetical protein
LKWFISEWRVIDNPIKGHQITTNNIVQDSAILDYELIKNGHPQMVDFGSGQGRSDIETGGVAALRRGIESSPRQAAGRIHRKDESLFSVRSLTPPQAARNALAIAVQYRENTGLGRKMPYVDGQ